MNVKALLREVKALTDFDDEAIGRLAAAARVADYSTGQVVVRVGEAIDALGVVASGGLAVALSGGARAEIAPGEVFGEMSLLTGEPAIAELHATGPSRVVHVPHDDLTREIGRQPRAARSLARLLAERLARRGDDPGERAALDQARKTLLPGTEAGTAAEQPVLVLNLGSSSIKYALFTGERRRAGGLIEKIGLPGSRFRHRGPAGELERAQPFADHEAGLRAVFELLVSPEHGAIERLEQLVAVGHRTVHGGTRFTEATVVDDAVIDELRRVSVLAPLHNPLNLLGIELCRRLLPPGVPQVGVFDTAFHMTMPEHAFRYALPRDLADERMLRRFGFHGTSHKYVAETACRFLGRPANSLELVTCHLGNGASVTAVDHGRSVDTSMGLTPLEGLVMGTRCGDLDPGLLLHLLGSGMTREEVDQLLNKRSGLLGLSGLSSDMRELETAADAGHPGALLAIQVFCYRVRKYIGAYAAAMGGIDGIVFTGGIGENAAGIRSRICQGLGFLGVELDPERNRERPRGAEPLRISREDAPVAVLVVPTDEEGAIAAETRLALRRSGVADVLHARRDWPIPVAVSAHHAHLSAEHVEALFGPGRRLTPRNELKQKGQFAAEETVDLIGPKGRVDRVRVLGPERPETQVEISRTEEFKLGIDAPIRASGDLAGSPSLTLRGGAGEVRLEQGVICALRHIHMAPEHALTYGIRDRDIVRVQLAGERSLIFGDVLVRVNPGWTLEMHIDTDEANAAEVLPSTTCTIESIQRRAG
ncbi:MAG TPA: acetate/propionate family kinase [Polyangia bacterium]|nr:acetate/propionate family kinase [Polyangia bacterium]